MPAEWRVDETVAVGVRQVVPDLPALLLAEGAFRRRVLRALVTAGLTQFLDLGCGEPGHERVGSLLRPHTEDWTCVYVDIDPTAVQRMERAVETDAFGREAVLTADLLDPDTLWDRLDGTGLIDPHQPLGVLLTGVAHHIVDTDALAGALGRYARRIVPGSHVAMTHFTLTGVAEAHRGQLVTAADLLDAAGGVPLVFRSPGQVADLLADYSPTEPGIVSVTEWDPGNRTVFIPEPRMLAVLATPACGP